MFGDYGVEIGGVVVCAVVVDGETRDVFHVEELAERVVSVGWGGDVDISAVGCK